MKTQLLILLGFFCLSFSASAQMLWNKTYGTASTTQNLNRMILLSNGDLLMVGDQFIPGSGTVISGSTYTIRTNGNGDTIWTRKHQPPGCTVGTINDAAEDNDGNIVLVGAGHSGNTSDYNGFILKLNSSGDTIWTKKIITPQNDRCLSVIIGNDGSYIVNCREFNVPVVKKISKSGQTLWSTPINFSSGVPGFVSGLTKAQNGYIAFSGTNVPAPMGKTVKLTEAGLEQPGYFNFAVAVYDVFTRPNFNMVACGSGRLYEFNAIGDTLWSKGYMMNTHPLSLTSAKHTSDGNYIALFDRYNGNDIDVGLMKVAPNGVAIKDTLLFRYGYNESSKDIVVDANGDYVFAGHAQVPGGNNHIFLAKHRQWGQTIGLKEDLDLAAGIKLYPNPAIDQITIESAKPLNGQLSLYNQQGQLVRQETVAQMQQKVLPLQNLPSGIYILRFVGEHGSQFNRKIVKQ